MTKKNKKTLLVEGECDKRIIPFLIEQSGTMWKQNNTPITNIISLGGIENILQTDIKTFWQESDLTSLGLIVDADEFPLNRWNEVRNLCSKAIPNIPQIIPNGGLIVEHDGKKFGIWIMPDNCLQGMIETFLGYLVPNQDENFIWQLAQCVVAQAKKTGAPFKTVHTDKAHIHTWLAWQDEPGRQLHEAIKFKLLDPSCAAAQNFVNWFRTLYL